MNVMDEGVLGRSCCTVHVSSDHRNIPDQVNNQVESIICVPSRNHVVSHVAIIPLWLAWFSEKVFGAHQLRVPYPITV